MTIPAPIQLGTIVYQTSIPANTGTATIQDLVGGEAGTPGTPDTFEVLAEFNSIFKFTNDVAEDSEVAWTIDNFVAGGFVGANINNWSKLDLSEIGVTKDVGINAILGDWDGNEGFDGLVVTADGFNFEIRLSGVFDPVFLTSDNLIFADNAIIA